MLTAQKRANQFKNNFLYSPSFRHLILSNNDLGERFDIIKNNFPKLFLNYNEYYLVTEHIDCKYPSEVNSLSPAQRIFLAAGKEIGYKGFLKKLFRFGQGDLWIRSLSSLISKWRVLDDEAYAGCKHHICMYDCDSCLMKDSYYEGIIGSIRRPTFLQKNQFHYLIYQIGRDKYLESINQLPKLT